MLPTSRFITRSLRAPHLRLALLAVCLAAPLLWGGHAQAAVTLVMQRGPDKTSTLMVDGDKMRMNNPDSRNPTVIIDAATKRMVMVNDAEKTYSEVTEADMKRFGEMIAARRAQMEEHMQSMPPEQRKRMEELLGPAGGKGAKPIELTFEKTGDKKTINGFSCTVYKVVANGAPKEEDCIAPWSASLLQRSDFAGLRKFAEDMAKSSGAMGPGGGRQMFEQFDKYPGFPVTRHPLSPGEHEDEELKSVKRGSIPASTFVVPAGYTKKEPPMGAFGAGGPPRGNFRPMPTPTQ